jgi:hypothetical protein
LTQRLRETNPTENLVGRDTIRRQPLHSAGTGTAKKKKKNMNFLKLK